MGNLLAHLNTDIYLSFKIYLHATTASLTYWSRLHHGSSIDLRTTKRQTTAYFGKNNLYIM